MCKLLAAQKGSNHLCKRSSLKQGSATTLSNILHFCKKECCYIVKYMKKSCTDRSHNSLDLLTRLLNYWTFWVVGSFDSLYLDLLTRWILWLFRALKIHTGPSDSLDLLTRLSRDYLIFYSLYPFFLNLLYINHNRLGSTWGAILSCAHSKSGSVRFMSWRSPGCGLCAKTNLLALSHVRVTRLQPIRARSKRTLCLRLISPTSITSPKHLCGALRAACFSWHKTGPPLWHPLCPAPRLV